MSEVDKPTARDVQLLPGDVLDESQRIYTYDPECNWWVAQDGHTVPQEAMPSTQRRGRIDP